MFHLRSWNSFLLCLSAPSLLLALVIFALAPLSTQGLIGRVKFKFIFIWKVEFIDQRLLFYEEISAEIGTVQGRDNGVGKKGSPCEENPGDPDFSVIGL
jgi:hypothetical protein